MRREYGILIGLAIATVLIYGQTLGFDFVDFDDPNYVIRNPRVTDGISLDNVAWAFTTGYEANWHPLTWISLMIDATIFGPGPAGFHATNVLLHVFNTLLLFWILRVMTGRDGPPAFVAALFALHPLHVESVAWITERKDVLSLFWGLLATWAYVAYCRRGGGRMYLLAAVCLALALMAKALVITLPCVFLLLDYWPLERIRGRGAAVAASDASSSRSTRAPAKQRTGASAAQSAKPAAIRPGGPFRPEPLGRVLLEKLPFLALVAAASVATFFAQRAYGAVTTETAVTLGQRVANALVSYVRYLGKTFWPSDLSVLYPHPNMAGGTPWAWWQIAGAALVLAAVSALVARYRRHRFLTVGWLWYLGTLVPMIGLVQVGTQALADRYTYLPLIGIFVMVAWTVDLAAQPRAAPRGERRRRGDATSRGRLPIAAAVVVLVACGVLAWRQIAVWRDSLTLGRHAIAAGPTGPKVHYNLGLALSNAGRNAEALPHYDEAIRLKPDHAKAYNNRGRSLHQLGRIDAAIASFQRAIAIDPEFELAYVNLSAALADAGRWDEAIAARREALRLNPDDAASHNNLGGLLATTGRLAEAVTQFERALKIDPDLADARRNLARARELIARADTLRQP